ncbi:MAG: hypothetical protein JWM34_851 [Ilumatobacteraceae bacterium]|nr:hypothetical protein [Ilumatobacteraceae bacterium]
MKRLFAALIGASTLAVSLGGAAADGPIDTIASGAAATVLATAVPATTDVVNIYNKAQALDPDVAARAISAVQAVHGAFAVGRGSSVGMAGVRRNGDPVQIPPGGFVYPMSISALPLNAVGPLMGKDVAGVLSTGAVVMGKTTADLRGAQAGDTVDLLAADGTPVRFTIGMVAPDDVVGGTEILMTPDDADLLGATVVTRILLWGFDSRDALEQAMTGFGLEPRVDVRIRRSWDPFDPDTQISMAVTKAQLGEFAYRVNADGVGVTMPGDWAAAHLPAGRVLLSSAVPIRAQCNLAIQGDLMAALDEVAAAGLGSQIDVANANTYGGCFNPRFNRISGSLGVLSRHAWAQALDTNTSTNGQGNTPHMDCDVVRIFRKHNFAWGGDFLTPDGMHFEWVGARRDQYQYPSRFCPNLPVAKGTDSSSARPVDDAGMPLVRATMLADDGFSGD